MSETLPREQLLLKLLKKTQADHDGETLIAIRMANKLLTDAGWDWEKLLSGKITVVEDPFKSIGVPTSGIVNRTQAPGRAPVQQPRPSTPPRPATAPQEPPRAQAAPPPSRPTVILGVSINRFPGYCWSCATEVIAGNGKIFRPSTHNQHAPSGWEVICNPCDNAGKVCTTNRAIVTKSRKKSIGDLA